MSAEQPNLKPCPLAHHVSTGLRVNKTDPKILCLDCGLTLAATDWTTLYERWNFRADLAPVAQPPEHDLPFDDYCAGKDCRACAGVNCTCQCHAPQVSDAELKAIESRIKNCRLKGGPDAMDTHILTNYVPRLVKDLQTARAASLQPPSPQSETFIEQAAEIVSAYKQRIVQLPPVAGEVVPCAKWLAMTLRIVLERAQQRGSELQREVDAKIAGSFKSGFGEPLAKRIAAAIRAAKQQ